MAMNSSRKVFEELYRSTNPIYLEGEVSVLSMEQSIPLPCSQVASNDKAATLTNIDARAAYRSQTTISSA